MKRAIIFRILLVAIAALIVPSCSVNPVTGKKQIMLMSESQEVGLGAQYDPEVMATFGEYKNDALLNFVTAQGNAMGKISHRPNLQYHFKILDSPAINAFAVPGGYIYFTRGILAQLNNEAELIGILGHEMGHITARHSASQQTKQQLGQLILVGGMIASEEFRQFANTAMQGMQLLFLKFSRDNEREADRLGVEYSAKVGYDATKMADFFHVLNKMQLASEHAGVPTFMSTHPDPGDRYNTVKQLAADWKTKLPGTDWKVNQDSYLRMIDGLIYGDDPRQGFIEGNTFYHPDLKFKFALPADWQTENTPMQFRMAAKDGKAMMMFTLAQQKNVDEAAQKTIEQYKLTLLDSKKISVNGLPAVAVVSKQVSQDQSTGQQQSISVLSYFIEHNQNVYVFHGLSGDADFIGYRSVFESTMTKFSRLTDPAKLNVKPKRIAIKKATKTATLADTFKAMGVPQSKMQELALLNDLELNQQVQAGRLLKTVTE